MTRHDTVESAKREAKRISRATSITHSQALDVLSVQAGHSHWGSYQKAIEEAVKAPAKFSVPYDMIAELVGDRSILPIGLEKAKHLIIAGSTSSGKTTLLNRLLRLAPKSMPIAVLDPASEIVNPNPIEHMHLNREIRMNHGAYEIMRYAAMRNGAGIIVYESVTRDSTLDIVSAFGRKDGPSVLTTAHSSTMDDTRYLLDNLIGFREGTMANSVACIQMSRDQQGRRYITDIALI